jgi:hypothetical protein
VTVATAATNKCAARYPHTKGAINGIATTIESVAKAAGPVAGAMLFAASLELRHVGPLKGAGVFFLAFGFVVGSLCAHHIDASQSPSPDTTSRDLTALQIHLTTPHLTAPHLTSAIRLPLRRPRHRPRPAEGPLRTAA